MHEELNLLSVILDHNAEKKYLSLGKKADCYEILKDYETPMKSGKIRHKLISMQDKFITKGIKNLKSFYLLASGKPRIYFDNTMKLFIYWEQQEKKL